MSQSWSDAFTLLTSIASKLWDCLRSLTIGNTNLLAVLFVGFTSLQFYFLLKHLGNN